MANMVDSAGVQAAATHNQWMTKVARIVILCAQVSPERFRQLTHCGCSVSSGQSKSAGDRVFVVVYYNR